MPIRYDNPREIGPDRLVNAVAGYDRVGGACVVVDFGTAVTHDVVSADGEYLGGVIFPGVEISLEALTERAAALPRIDLTPPRALIGKSTVDAIRAGVLYGFAGMVDGIVGRLRDELGDVHDAGHRRAGGRGRAVLRTIDEVDDLLTLTGLRLIWERNQESPNLAGVRSLQDPWTLGGIEIPNRVVLAPLAGIGNWFVRLQAKRYGAGLAVSEMISSFAIHYGNRKTLDELLVIHPDEGPVAIQLFGQDPEIMRSAAAEVARAGADMLDLNMGCPVPKVTKTGAGAALIKDPDTAVAVARAAREGSGLPVTVKLRAAIKPGGVEGLELAQRLVDEAGVAGITFHPRSAAVRHKGTPDYDLARGSSRSCPCR